MSEYSKKTIKNDFFEFQNNENLEKSVIGENEKEVFPFYLQYNEYFQKSGDWDDSHLPDNLKRDLESKFKQNLKRDLESKFKERDESLEVLKKWRLKKRDVWFNYVFLVSFCVVIPKLIPSLFLDPSVKNSLYMYVTPSTGVAYAVSIVPEVKEMRADQAGSSGAIVPLSSGLSHPNQLTSTQRGQIARQGVIALQRKFGGLSVAQAGKGSWVLCQGPQESIAQPSQAIRPISGSLIAFSGAGETAPDEKLSSQEENQPITAQNSGLPSSAENQPGAVSGEEMVVDDFAMPLHGPVPKPSRVLLSKDLSSGVVRLFFLQDSSMVEKLSTLIEKYEPLQADLTAKTYEVESFSLRWQSLLRQQKQLLKENLQGQELSQDNQMKLREIEAGLIETQQNVSLAVEKQKVAQKKASDAMADIRTVAKVSSSFRIRWNDTEEMRVVERLSVSRKGQAIQGLLVLADDDVAQSRIVSAQDYFRLKNSIDNVMRENQLSFRMTIDDFQAVKNNTITLPADLAVIFDGETEIRVFEFFRFASLVDHSLPREFTESQLKIKRNETILNRFGSGELSQAGFDHWNNNMSPGDRKRLRFVLNSGYDFSMLSVISKGSEGTTQLGTSKSWKRGPVNIEPKTTSEFVQWLTPYVVGYEGDLYYDICKILHTNTEHRRQMRIRLPVVPFAITEAEKNAVETSYPGVNVTNMVEYRNSQGPSNGHHALQNSLGGPGYVENLLIFSEPEHAFAHLGALLVRSLAGDCIVNADTCPAGWLAKHGEKFYRNLDCPYHPVTSVRGDSQFALDGLQIPDGYSSSSSSGSDSSQGR